MDMLRKAAEKLPWFYVLIAVVVIAAINAITGGKKNDKINWDNVELHQRLPVPPSNKGSLYTNTAEELSVFTLTRYPTTDTPRI